MDEKGFDYMNVVPLVDVMMVLLTIVLMASTFVASGAIPVSLPKASQKQTVPLKAATVTIDRKGAIYFDSTPVTLPGLEGRLAGLDRETAVQVKADRSITLQECVDVLDLLSAKGFRKVSLQTERNS